MTMPDLLTRTALPADAAAIRALVRAAYAKWVPILGREPRPMQADYDAALRRHRFDLVEDAGRLVGLIETEVRADHLWIENLAVLPAAQGRGLGRQLLAHAEGLTRASGLFELRLLTNGLMVANRALYGSLGYVETAEEPFMDSTVVYLSKRLPPVS
jgi:ribosomal protein S18 acetylase RimI-like enzyme